MGGCYAKAINLSPETEPDIFQALRFGAVLENVVLDEERLVDYTDVSLTENTRGAYPIEFIQNTRIPCIVGHDLTLSRNVPVYPRNFSSRAKRGPTSRLTTPARKSSRNCSTRTLKNTSRAWTPRSKRLRR
jgi:hypothetical protein